MAAIRSPGQCGSVDTDKQADKYEGGWGTSTSFTLAPNLPVTSCTKKHYASSVCMEASLLQVWKGKEHESVVLLASLCLES